MRVLVTGGSGFLGSAVVRALVSTGHQVVAAVRKSSYRTDLEAMTAVRVVEVDLLDQSALQAAMVACDRRG